MFTGIIQGLGILVSLNKTETLYQIGILLPDELLDNIQIGASISVDGTCLTVVRVEGQTVYFDIVAQTLDCTNFRALALDQKLNIERSLKMGDEIGGHVLSGHIYGTATVSAIKHPSQEQRVIHFRCPRDWMDMILPKGFIAVSGASLTVVDTLPEGEFWVHLIPETLKITHFDALAVGDQVNIEIDAQTQTIVNTVKKYLDTKKLA